MSEQKRFGRKRIYLMLFIFIAVLTVIGILMRSKMQLLLSDYVENQITKQAAILAQLLEEDLNIELKNLENIATYIQADNENMESLLKIANSDDEQALWGIIELDGTAVCGAELPNRKFAGIQNSFRGNSAVSYLQNEGMLFTVPIFHGNNIKYVLFKFCPEEQLTERFGMSFYHAQGKVLVVDRNDQVIIKSEKWTKEDDIFLEEVEVKTSFAEISEQMNVSTAASSFCKEAGGGQYIFVSEVGEHEILLVGVISQDVAEEGIGTIITLVLWVFGLLLMLLAVGVAFLFAAEEKALEADELREAKVVADSANRAKSDFLASMSHEIRTPINAVMGLNEMILRESDDDNIKEYSINIQNASKTLISLINDILDLSKIEAGKMEILPDNYELSNVLNDVVNMIQLKARQKGLQFKVDIDEKIPNKLYGDEIRIRQILINILNNAVKYTKEGMVHLTVNQEKIENNQIILKVAVKDSGIGIKKEDMGKLFENFERLDTMKNRNVEGTGLGLSITSKMIALMNGTMNVESVYGEGSTFYIELPQTVIENVCIGDFEERFSEYVKNMKTYAESFIAPDAEILVVDDNKMNLLVAQNLLKNTKVKVTCCESGEEALEICRKQSFDVILLDHLMEGMDGIETLKCLRADESSLCSQKIVIALTANAIVGAREEYLSAGFNDYLSKPIIAEKLEELLRKYIPKEKIMKQQENGEPESNTKKADIEHVDVSVTPVLVKDSEIKQEKASDLHNNVTESISEEKIVNVYLEQEKTKEGIIQKWKKKFIDTLFHDDLEIQHKLLNLILFAAFAGGTISLVISSILGLESSAIFVIAILVVVVGLCLWIANVKKKPRLSALLITIAANLFIFPIMYFTSGGISSGMPIWLLLGLIFSFLLLKGKVCIIMYLLNAFVVIGCYLIELFKPELVTTIASREVVFTDMVQSTIVVTCVFGAIFKYQTHVYEKQKKAILKANKAKNEFLANMSHEIRTPINAILGYNELIMRESKESQSVEYAMNVQSAGRTLLSMVNDILDFSSMDTEEWKMNAEPYSTMSLVQDILAYAKYNAEDKKLEIKTDIDEKLPQVLSGDMVRLLQIINNLISNAVKYTKEGHIKVVVQWKALNEKKGLLKFSVEDTGIGMRDEDLQRISEIFVRFDNRQTRNIQGSGLGLTIVTRLLRLMGSKLVVESEFGKGSVFSFEVEQDIVERTPIGGYVSNYTYKWQDTVDEYFEAPEARILVVDDNPTNLDLVKGILKTTRMHITIANNGKEAVDEVRKNHYHIIFMDHMMPVMDGIEALNVMRKEKLCPDTPIVVLTANMICGAKKSYLEAGFDDYLSKPVYSKDLYSMLKKYLPKELQLVKVKENQNTADSNPIDIQSANEKEKSFIDYLPSLDTDTGLTYCCGSEEFYIEMLNSYTATNKYDEIAMNYEEEKWDKYRILVHALKSTSLSIGAVALSESAKELEFAAKEDRIDYIKEHHETMMENYQAILAEITAALEHV